MFGTANWYLNTHCREKWLLAGDQSATYKWVASFMSQLCNNCCRSCFQLTTFILKVLMFSSVMGKVCFKPAWRHIVDLWSGRENWFNTCGEQTRIKSNLAEPYVNGNCCNWASGGQSWIVSILEARFSTFISGFDWHMEPVGRYCWTGRVEVADGWSVYLSVWFCLVRCHLILSLDVTKQRHHICFFSMKAPKLSYIGKTVWSSFTPICHFFVSPCSCFESLWSFLCL